MSSILIKIDEALEAAGLPPSKYRERAYQQVQGFIEKYGSNLADQAIDEAVLTAELQKENDL